MSVSRVASLADRHHRAERFAASAERAPVLPRLGRAALPLSRVIVLVVLLMAALADFGHGRRAVHEAVFAGYGLITALQVGAERRFKRSGIAHWIAIVTAALDAMLASCIILQHVPQSGHEAEHAIDATSLFPAFLFLLQTGVGRRSRAILTFSATVAVWWAYAILSLVGSDPVRSEDGLTVLVRQGLGLATFTAATALVFGAVVWLNQALSLSVRRHVRFARFLPRGLVTDLAAGRDVRASERHACLLSIHLCGYSDLSLRHRPSDIMAWLMSFRRLVHDAVTVRGGKVDKYIGDGVLAIFVEHAAGHQAGQAVLTVRQFRSAFAAWNLERAVRGEPVLQVAIALHCGPVLVGVFDDGRRAEHAVLGPAANTLTHIGRVGRQAGVEVVASQTFVDALPPVIVSRFVAAVPLASDGPGSGLESLCLLAIADTENGSSTLHDCSATHAQLDAADVLHGTGARSRQIEPSP